MDKLWYEQRLRCKPSKAVVRLCKDDGTFLEGVNIPTDRWPLSGPYEVFYQSKCVQIEDPEVIRLVDAVPYRIGHCYSNAEAVTATLVENGFDAVQYAGWMFVDESQYPIHHSWTVLNGNQVIDLADEFSVLAFNRDKFGDAGIDECRNLFVEFTRWISQFPNSQRTKPFGVPSAQLLYIGCPSNRLDAINLFNKLVDACPNHPCRERVGKNDMTKMQEMLAAEGLF